MIRVDSQIRNERAWQIWLFVNGQSQFSRISNSVLLNLTWWQSMALVCTQTSSRLWNYPNIILVVEMIDTVYLWHLIFTFSSYNTCSLHSTWNNLFSRSHNGRCRQTLCRPKTVVYIDKSNFNSQRICQCTLLIYDDTELECFSMLSDSLAVKIEISVEIWQL